MRRSRDNTAQLAKALWTFEARDLDAAEFQARFDKIYTAAEGPATLWQLGGAANDYLRAHPASIRVPNELAHTLLASKLVDARIIGLKLLTRCSSNLPAVVAAICLALEQRNEGEMRGGLHELENLLDRLPRAARLPTQELLPRLQKLRSSSDPFVPKIAQRLADRLEDLATA